MYSLKAEDESQYSLQEIRTIQDWIVKPQLRTVPGVTGVLSIGGEVKQYQVNIDAQKLQARNLTVSDVRGALTQNNRNVGASFITRGGEEYIVRGYGWVNSGTAGIKDIRNIIVSKSEGESLFTSRMWRRLALDRRSAAARRYPRARSPWAAM